MPTPQPATGDDLTAEACALPIALLAAQHIYCRPVRDSAGTYLVLPLADGSDITFTGTTTDGIEVRTHHPVHQHGSWQASWTDGDTHRPLYDSTDQHLPHRPDTETLVAAIVTCVNAHGGNRTTPTPR
ncbi:hypothetical protein ACF1AB_39635 [Streptomyces sp. NPDC014846]|uniref:hypothetical protein n=1 Tax=Streptomyces sp. NPDC014846 TaxID=3364922 RepID=UPI0037033306